MFITSGTLCYAKALFVFTCTAFCALMYSAAHAADLTVLVNNVQQDTGQVMLGVFNKAEGFPNAVSQGSMVAAKERNANGQVRIVFKGLAAGQYAATAYHDLDSNNKLNTNIVGIPTEPYGFSNNARGSFGPPSFKEAAITVGDQDLTVEVTLK